jgi:hypothetical protein
LTSETQVEANRRNALKSTGPKDTSLTRRNALKHGLTAEKLVVLPYEDPVEYEELVERFFAEFQPETAVEEFLVEQMATSIWRLRRIRKAERAEIQKRMTFALAEFALEESKMRSEAVRKGNEGLLPTNPSLYSSPDLQKYLEYFEKLPRDQRQHEHDPINDGDNVILSALNSTAVARERMLLESELHPNLDALTLRYESGLEGQFYRALMMLTKIRKDRIGFVSQNTSERVVKSQ